MLMLPIIKPLNESAQTEKSLDSLGPGFAPEESAEGKEGRKNYIMDMCKVLEFRY